MYKTITLVISFLLEIISGIAWLSFMFLMSIFFILYYILQFSFLPFIILFQLFIFVPVLYFKVKRPLEEDIREIDINFIERKVCRSIEKKIFTYELRGFKSLSLLELQVDKENKLYLQIMINNKLGISLALYYSVKIDKNLKYKEIEKEYITFEFENLEKELIQITNNKGIKLPTQKDTYQYFIDFDADVHFYEWILTISKKGLIHKQSDTLIRTKNNPLLSIKENTIYEKNYLLASKYFIKKEDYLTLSLKASFALVFKGIYPINRVFNYFAYRKSEKYFESKDIFLDTYLDENFREEYYKKIDNLKKLKEYFNTNNKYLEIAKQHQIEKIKFSFYEECDDFIEKNLDILSIDIELTAQKKVSNNRCLYSNYEININNENDKSFLYYHDNDIRLYKYEKINPFIELNNYCIEIEKVQKVINHKYKEAIIIEISLEIFNNKLSYIVLIYKLKIDEETVKIYLDAITAEFLEK